MLKALFKRHFAKNILRNIQQIGIRHHCGVPAIVMNNGNEMPIIGFGTWSSTNDFRLLEKLDNIGQQKTDSTIECTDVKSNSEKIAKAVGWAIDAGYRHIDCAHLYKNQREIGQVLKKKIESKIVTRDDLFITSKLWNTFHDPENVCSACKETLDDLCIDYLDMYLMHTPMGFSHSCDLFPMCEGKIMYSEDDYIDTWHAMEDLVRNKMCKNIGISNFNSQQIKRLAKTCKIMPQTLQIELHPYLTQKKLVHFAKLHDICITAYAPVGSPDRPWAKAEEERTLLTDYKILQLAEKHKRSPAQILLRFQIQSGHAVIPKCTDRKHIKENINILDFELCPDDIRNIESLNHNLRYFEFSGSFGHPHHPFEAATEIHLKQKNAF